MAAVACVSSTARAADVIEDAATRAEYGFYAREISMIESAIGALEGASTDELAGLRLTQLGYAHWKVAQLLATTDPQVAIAAAEACIAALHQAVAAADALAETHALQSACYGLLAGLGGALKGAWNGRRSGKSLELALTLAPDNPRVRLIDALNDYARPEAGDRVRAHRKFRDAVLAFETGELASSDADLEWGHAEALAWLGESSLAQGDLVTAREALEKALIIAPHYEWARNLLDEMTRTR